MALTLYVQKGDWVVDEATGRPLTVSGLAKTRQDLGELLSIDTQSNGFGASIVDLIGTVPDAPEAVAFSVMERISAAVSRWMGLQRRARTALAKNETVAKLAFNQARVDDSDPTSVLFRVAITTRSGEEVARGGSISPPGSGE